MVSSVLHAVYGSPLMTQKNIENILTGIFGKTKKKKMIIKLLNIENGIMKLM